MDQDFIDICKPPECSADPNLVEMQCREVIRSIKILQDIFDGYEPAIERLENAIYHIEILQNRYGPEHEKKRQEIEKQHSRKSRRLTGYVKDSTLRQEY